MRNEAYLYWCITHSWDCSDHQNIWWSTNFFLPIFFYFIFFAWSKVGLVQKILKRLGNVAWFQYKTAPQKNKGVSQKYQNKNFVKKEKFRESPNILVVRIPWMSSPFDLRSGVHNSSWVSHNKYYFQVFKSANM